MRAISRRGGGIFIPSRSRRTARWTCICGPHVLPLTTEDGATDYDVEMLVVRGVEPFDGMEEDIRARYDDWCASAEVVYL